MIQNRTGRRWKTSVQGLVNGFRLTTRSILENVCKQGRCLEALLRGGYNHSSGISRGLLRLF